MKVKVVEHTFGPQDTVKAALRRYNNLDLTPEEVDELMRMYQTLNGAHCPRVYDRVKIPIKESSNG